MFNYSEIPTHYVIRTQIDFNFLTEQRYYTKIKDASSGLQSSQWYSARQLEDAWKVLKSLIKAQLPFQDKVAKKTQSRR